MALAIDRQAIVEHITQGGQKPAASWVPVGTPGYDKIANDFISPRANLAKAKELMAKVENPVREVKLYTNTTAGQKEIAVAVQAFWKQLGLDVTIEQMEWPQYVQFLGPPANEAVDVYRNTWIGDFVDAFNFLEVFTCESGNNYTGFCNKKFDALLDKARSTTDASKRFKLYAQAEDVLTSPAGAMPIIPIYSYTYPNLENAKVRDTFNMNLLAQIDLSKVVVLDK
jgi:oligopeptide transport system substrate-binding protein